MCTALTHFKIHTLLRSFLRCLNPFQDLNDSIRWRISFPRCVLCVCVFVFHACRRLERHRGGVLVCLAPTHGDVKCKTKKTKKQHPPYLRVTRSAAGLHSGSAPFASRHFHRRWSSITPLFVVLPVDCQRAALIGRRPEKMIL